LDAPWPPQERAARERWAEIAMLEDTRTDDPSRLVGMLQSDAEALVRWRVCRAFARLQDTSAVVVDALLDAVRKDADVRVRREAAFALGQVGSRRATQSLAFLARAPGDDPGVRACAVEALGKLGDRRGTGAVAGLLTHPDVGLSREAAIACWRLADSSAVPGLLEGAKSRDAWTRAFTAYALERVPMPAFTLKPLANLVADAEMPVRAYAARALGRHRTPEALGLLVGASQDPDARVRVVVQRSFGLLADSTALPQVLAGLLDPDAAVRETAAEAAGRLRSRDALPGLRKALGDADPAVRLAAGRSLVALGGEAAWIDIVGLLADPERFVRAGMFEALGGMPGANASLTLRKVAAGLRPVGGNASFEERSAAFSGLAARKAADARAEIVSGLSSGSWLVAASACEAAGASGDSTLVPDLVRLYRNNPDAREADVPLGVCGALETLGPRAARVPAAAEARAVLEDALASPDARLRAAAAKACAAVFGDSARAAAERTYRPPAWRPAALATYRELLAAEDSIGAIGRIRGARLTTSKGVIELSLEPREAPLTVRNFAALADSGYYRETRWHRVVPYFVVQDGDPTATGAGGPGWAIRCEYNHLRYDTGALGMALSGKDTGGSQYFITLSPQPHLDGRYTIFGHVVRGQDVVGRIRRGDRIERVEILRR
jgi:cyclophilin family peptidyl-prolyl cis-trans isomerase/HEAT repeat protein